MPGKPLRGGTLDQTRSSERPRGLPLLILYFGLMGCLGLRTASIGDNTLGVLLLGVPAVAALGTAVGLTLKSKAAHFAASVLLYPAVVVAFLNFATLSLVALGPSSRSTSNHPVLLLGVLGVSTFAGIGALCFLRSSQMLEWFDVQSSWWHELIAATLLGALSAGLLLLN